MKLMKTPLFATCVLFAGCAAVPPHSAPASKDVAYISSGLKTESDYSFFGGVSGRSFGIGELDQEGCIDPRGFHPVTDESLDENGYAVVKAGEEIALSAGVQRGNAICGIQVGTTLQKDTLYKLSFNAKEQLGIGVNYVKCGIGLAKVEDDGSYSPVDIELLKVGFTKFCKVAK